jgi:hypothetical protein
MKGKSIVLFIGFIIAVVLPGCGPKTAPIKYDPVNAEMIHKELGQNVTVAILDFPDERKDSEGKETMVGTVYGGFKNPVKRIYSEQPINLDVIDALGNLFSANGFDVKKYPGVMNHTELTDERLVVQGQINKFWSEVYQRMGAIVDIDISIYDRKHDKFVWSGKIEDFQKKGASLDTTKMFSLLTEVLANAIRKAWTEQGMQQALKSWSKE